MKKRGISQRPSITPTPSMRKEATRKQRSQSPKHLVTTPRRHGTIVEQDYGKGAPTKIRRRGTTGIVQKTNNGTAETTASKQQTRNDPTAGDGPTRHQVALLPKKFQRHKPQLSLIAELRWEALISGGLVGAQIEL